jgi:uncharacterized membrane protein YidH (DUF202 family)
MSKTTEEPIVMDTSTRLAYDRTRLAYENTMMAWVRTATSLITFGFSVYKFFQFDTKGAAHVERLVGPRGFALMMITCGLVSLAAGNGATHKRHAAFAGTVSGASALGCFRARGFDFDSRHFCTRRSAFPAVSSAE